MKKLYFLALVMGLAFCGCCSKCVDDDDDDDVLITQPVTNNPLIVPSHGSGIPGMPSMPGSMPGSPR